MREAFERWISSPPYEKNLDKFPSFGTWPGQYRDYVVQLAWEAWKEALEKKEQADASPTPTK